MPWLSDLLQGVPLNSVLRERVALAEQKFKDIEAENKSLKERVSALTAENDTYRKLIAQQRADSQFVERRGVLWKREDDGHYLPCCPRCKTALTPMPPWSHDFLDCTVCKFKAPFHPNEVKQIAATLPK